MSGWQNKPFLIEVKAGETKAFCACGLSKSGPFCDGAHAKVGKSPQFVDFEQTKKVSICGCRNSVNQPFCDGSHSKG